MFERKRLSETVERDTVRAVSKIVLAALATIFVLYLFTLLPGVDRLIPRTSVTFAAVIGAILTLVVVALLLALAPKLSQLTKLRMDGPQEVVENTASIVYWLVVLVAILVAHRGLAGALQPVFDGVGWLYDLAFLLLALPAVFVIAVRLYTSLDPAAEHCADRVT